MWIKSIAFTTLVVIGSACVSIKPTALFDESSSKPEPPHIENFYALNILNEKLSGEVWYTQNVKCIRVENSEENVFAGSNAVHLKWDKQEGGCDWIGMGIGWDGWAPKDLSMIMNKAAIQFKVFSTGGKIKGLPLAAAMEDYAGKSAWIGFAGKYISYKNDESWATVTLPIGDFDWDMFDADASNVKQMIIQFEAAGDVYFDEISVVPFEGTLNKTYITTYVDNTAVTLDGMLNESIWQNSIVFENQAVSVVGSRDYLYVSGSISDNTPLLNNKSGNDVWNGDGVELAFSTNVDANPKRKQLLLTDQHVCIKLGANTQVWDYQADKVVEGAEIATIKTTTGYTFEAKIPYSHFEMGHLQPNTNYHFELAVNDGDGTKRTKQIKWNSAGIEGFHKNPSLWGNIQYKAVESE